MPNYNLSKFISNEKYYDFKDVLILPTISSLNSRSEVDLTRKFVFNNGQKWEGIPIIKFPSDLIVFQEIIHKIKPDLIITHSNIDYHSDHRVLSNYISVL